MNAFPGKLFLVLIFMISVAAFVPAQDFLPELVRRIKPSAVAIETFDGRGRNVSRGSGFFVGTDRIITNKHVIEKATRVVIHLTNGNEYTAQGILAIDGEGDLALIKVNLPSEFARPLPIVATTPEEGESIVVIGNPYGLEGSVSNGIVSAVREIPGYGKIIQITAPISPGSSGSPVVNMFGQVIGVATLQASEGQSLNFAVPSERISRLDVGDTRSFATVSAENRENSRAIAERFYSRGLAILSSDDYARALPYFEQAVRADAGYAEAWYQVGFCYGMLGKHKDSLRASRKAAGLRPEWVETYVNIGASSFALQRYKDAAAAYKIAARLDETNADTQISLGLTYGKLGRTAEEALAYRRAVSIKPDSAKALQLLGTAYYKQKRFKKAIDVFERLRHYKSDAETYNLLGESLFASGKVRESIDAFTNAVNMNPEMERIRFNLGRAHLKAGEPGLARVQYEILKANQSDWADRLFILMNP